MGRGLGLSAVQGIVRSHKGAMRVYSTPGKGTTLQGAAPCHGSASVQPGINRGVGGTAGLLQDTGRRRRGQRPNAPQRHH